MNRLGLKIRLIDLIKEKKKNCGCLALFSRYLYTRVIFFVGISNAVVLLLNYSMVIVPVFSSPGTFGQSDTIIQ